MKKIELEFMVVPEQLQTRAYVPNPVRVRIIKPDSSALNSILGKSGRKLAKAGIDFFFTRKLADTMIELGIAKEVVPMVSMAKINKNAREIWGRKVDWKQSHNIAAAIGVPLHEDRLEQL